MCKLDLELNVQVISSLKMLLGVGKYYCVISSLKMLLVV